MIVADWLSWPGYVAFLITSRSGPHYLIQIERKDLARRLRAGESIKSIVMGEE